MTEPEAARNAARPGQPTVNGVHRRLIRRHAEDAAFYWARRQDAALSGAHDLRSLARFDGLLDANLEGLRVAQREGQPPDHAGWQPTWQRTQQWKTADEAFVAAVLALETAAQRGDGARLVALQELACDQLDDSRGLHDLSLARGLTSAAAWLPWPTVEAAVQRWSQSPEPALRRCALAACGLHRVPAGAALPAWLEDPHRLVRARALRAVGELGRGDLAGPLVNLLRPAAASEPGAAQDRQWAAWALCMLGCADSLIEGPEATSDEATSSNQRALLAAWAVAAADKQVADWVAAALQDRARWRAALTAIRYSGQARWLPVLLQLMEHQLEEPALQSFFDEPRSNLARLAADVFAHISGLRLADQHWMPEPEDADGTSDDSALDPTVSAASKHDIDHGLLWPDLVAVKRWWSAQRQRFNQTSGHASRYLGGRPLVPASAEAALADPIATQLQRHQAALYLRCNGHTETLFDVRATLPLQRRRAAVLGLIIP